MTTPLLELHNLELTLSGKNILKDTNLVINRGDFVVLLGSNGSGKSSLLSLINRRKSPSIGDIKLNKKNLKLYDSSEYAKRVVTISQNVHDNLFKDMTLFENAKLYVPKIQKSFLKSFLSQYNKKLADGLDRLVHQFSGGEQQLFVLALCCQLKPDILLLDEHTSALDPKIADQVMELTQEFITHGELTCLMTTHNLAYAQKYGNRLITLQNGRIISDKNIIEKQSLKTSDLLSQYA